MLHLLFSIVIILCIFWFLYALTRNTNTHVLSAFPQPKSALPFLGVILDFPSSHDVLPRLLSYFHETNSRIVYLRVGFEHRLLVADRDLAAAIFRSTNAALTKSDIYHNVQDWLGKGLITGNGQHWHQHRRLLSPAFHSSALERFLTIFDEHARSLVGKFQEQSAPSVAVNKIFGDFTLDVGCDTILGYRTQCLDSSGRAKYMRSVREMSSILASRTYSMWKSNPFLFSLTKDYDRKNRALEHIDGVTKRLLEEKRKLRKDERREDYAIIDVLLESGLDDKSIRDEVNTLFFASHDTTASALSSSIYCLARYPGVQELVYREQKDLFDGDRSRGPSLEEHQKNLPYLKAFVREVLRLYPPVPLISRKLDQDLVHDGVVLPKGLHISLDLHAIHHDPVYHPDPERFDPGRWLSHECDDLQKKRGDLESAGGSSSAYVYVPFSAGPRNCIGQRFAVLEIQSVLSVLTRNFVFSECEPPHLPNFVQEITLTSTNGVRVKVTQRE